MNEVQTVRPHPDWETARETKGVDGTVTLVQVRHALGSHLRDTYPAGAHDLEITLDAGSGDGLAAVLAVLFAEQADCRRIVLAIAPEDESAAAIARGAGMNGVVEVDLPDGGSVVLWVAEPERVRARSTDIDDLPQT
jgi:hypothetical protein